MSKPVLSIRNLTVVPSHVRGADPILNDVSFDVRTGQVHALVGESGSGKTMTSRAILGLLPPGLEVSRGSILFQDRNLLEYSKQELLALRGAKVGLVFQEPMTSLNPALTIGRQLTEAQKRHFQRSEEESRSAAVDMLDRLQVPNPQACLAKYPHEFSGGLRQRILIAGILALRPDLIVADEPTTALDVLIQQEVLELMVSAVRDIGSTVLLITHDLGVVARYADRVGIMQNGRLLEQTDISSLLKAPQHEYTRNLLDAIPVRGIKPDQANVSHEPLIEVENLAVDYLGRKRLPWRRAEVNRVLQNVNLTIRPGEMLAVVGESGSGKTTLAKAILGLVPAVEGCIRIRQQDTATLSRQQLNQMRRKTQMVFQDPYSALDPRMSVNQIIAEGLRHTTLSAPARAERTRQALLEVDLGEDHGNRFPHQLSGGQRQRVNIARALVSKPGLIMADEPVSALDVTVQAGILTLLERLQTEYGFACLFISHDLAVVEQIAHRVIVLYRGEIVEEGSCAQIFDDPRHPYTCALLNAAPRLIRRGGQYHLDDAGNRQATAPPGYEFEGWQHRPMPRQPERLEVEEGHWLPCYPATQTR